jgi:methylthioribose-1-phosphate isomerase
VGAPSDPRSSDPLGAGILLPLRWEGDSQGSLEIVDQTRIPNEERRLQLRRPEEVFDAIRCLAVRGAPAIGVAGGYGVVLGLRKLASSQAAGLAAGLESLANYLKSARPTAVNLAWAVDRVAAVAREKAKNPGGAAAALEAAFEAARAIDEENRLRCEKIGAHGATLLRDGDVVYTHCNTGPLATAGIGTALGVVFTAASQGKRISVVAGETRPLLQGARLTTYECLRAGIPVTLATDSMAASVFAKKGIACVIVGADRIAANGDTANKIGTLGVAVLARHYGIPFYVAAPLSTFDRSLPDGMGIPIEERSAEEVTDWGSIRTAPEGVAAMNPAFDVTPASLIAGIITEAGIAAPPTRETIGALFQRGT